MLQEARTAAGMSIADLAAATRIRPAVIRAMEEDDFTPCGGDAYAKGQIRSIARAVGVDPDAMLATFDGRPVGAASEEDPAPRRGLRRDAPRVPEKVTVNAAPEPSGRGRTDGLALLGAGDDRPARGFNWTAAMLVAVLALVTVGVVSVVTRNSGGGSVDEVAAPVATSSAPVAPPTPTATPTPTPTVQPSDDAVAQATDQEVEVTVEVTGDKSWLSVTEGKAGTSLYEGLVVTGDTQTFTSQKKIRVVVGNAGAVTLSVDGEDLGTPGGTGEVVRLEFAPGETAGLA
jgi:cytoskeleton protein RodZ